ncbi:MAG: hypothetical protein U1F87_06945 [Kiritimatiellia bacterium]
MTSTRRVAMAQATPARSRSPREELIGGAVGAFLGFERAQPGNRRPPGRRQADR